MERQGDEVHITTDEARAGAPPQGVRYVLAISLILVVLAFAVIVLTGIVTGPDRADNIERNAPTQVRPADRPIADEEK